MIEFEANGLHVLLCSHIPVKMAYMWIENECLSTLFVGATLDDKK